MENDAGEWDRYEQLCVFHLFVATTVRSAEPLTDELVHMSLDSYCVAFPIGFGFHTYGVTGSQPCINKIVSVPGGLFECAVRFAKTFRVFVNQLKAYNFIGYVGHQVQAVKVPLERAVVSDIVVESLGKPGVASFTLDGMFARRPSVLTA